MRNFFLYNWVKLLLLIITFGFSQTGFSANLVISGITSPSAANGVYIPYTTTPTINGKDVWVHQSGGYYIYNDIYQSGNPDEPYWNIDVDLLDQNGNDVLFASNDNSSASLPTFVTSWSPGIPGGTGSPLVSLSAVPEIRITGNALGIVDGSTSPQINNLTNFGSSDVATGTIVRTFTIYNDGSANLLLTGSSPYVTISGTDAADFSVTAIPSSTIAASSNTTFQITFNPSAEGIRSASLSIGNNDSDEDPYNFNIQGWGYAPKDLTVSGIASPAANGTYIHQGVSNNFEYWKHNTLNYYIYNDGSNWLIDDNQLPATTLFYSNDHSSDPVPLNVSTWTTENGTGTPVLAYASAIADINVKGNGLSITDGDATPSLTDQTDFGAVELTSATITRTFTIENTGGALLTLSGTTPYVTISGTNAIDFSVTTPPTSTIAAYGSTTFVITFNPSAEGDETATLTINSDDADEAIYNFDIKGSGYGIKNLLVSGITSPAAANGIYIHQGTFSDFQYWKHATQNYYIYNDDEGGRFWNIDVNQVDSDNDYLYYKSTEVYTPVGLTLWTENTGITGNPTIVYAGPEMNVQGNGNSIADGDATPSATDHTDFGSVSVSSGTIVRTFTIQNTGYADLNLSGTPKVAVSGTNAADFSVTAQPTSPVAALSGSITFQITFDPSAGGTRTSDISIINDDSDENPYNFSIQGFGIAPTITTVSVPSNATYGVGQNLDFTVNYSETVNVVGGTPYMLITLNTGGTVNASYISGNGSTALVFRYTIVSGNSDNDGVLVSSSIALNGATIQNDSSVDANLTLNGVGPTTGVLVDGIVPIVSGVNSSTANGSYKTSDIISVQVNFSKAVTVTGTPQLTIETGTTDQVVNYASGSGTSILTFTYTIQTGDVNADLDYQSTSALALNGGTIKDAAGNTATLTLAAPGAANSLGANKAIVIDGIAPTVSSVTSSIANGTYKAGDAISIQVNFSEAVTVTGTPQLTLETGTTDQVTNYASGSGTSTLRFTYTIQAGDVSADLDCQSTTALAQNGGTIKDAAGNNATLTLAVPGAANSLGSNKDIVVDGIAPTISNVNSVTANGTYKTGDAISIQVNLSEAVTVTGTPQLTLETGTTDQVIDYASGSGTSTLTFTYTVQAGDESTDLDYQSISALALNGGTIKDAAGNSATLTLAATGAANSLGNNKAIVIDGIAPTVISVNSTTTNGSYMAGDVISIQVNFSEAVTVTGTTQLTLETGTTDQVINYASGSGTSTLTFNYTIQMGDVSADLDYQSTSALSLNSGTIKDAAGNNAILILATPGAVNSLGANKAIVIDGIAPIISSVNSSTANGTYKTGDAISIQINFSEAVTVTGTPTLDLNSGGTVSYNSGSGTSTLTFNYTVGIGQSSTDLDYSTTTSLSLNGGTIKDAVGNNAIITLPTVGGANSLGGQKNIEIAIAPTVTTQAVTAIGTTTATGNGNITSLGIPNPTAYGVCWNTSVSPTITDNNTDKGSASSTGAFTANMTSLAMGTTYYVRAYATNATGTAYGSEVSFTTTTITIPEPPTGVSASTGNGYAIIYFTAPTYDGGSPVTVYTVTSNPGGKTATGTTSPINVTGLSIGENYTFTVTATNSIGTSLPSSVSNSVTITTTPDKPTNVTAIAGNSQATVSFDAPSFDGGSSINSYIVKSNPGAVIKYGASSPLIVTGLTNGVSYTFTVAAINSRGSGDISLPSQAVTPATVPGAPSEVIANMINGELMVRFTSPALDGGSVITGYIVKSNPEGITFTGTSSPIIVSGLTNGTSYTFSVAATNAFGTGEYSTASEPFNSYAGTSLWKGIGNWDETSKWDNGIPSPETIITIDGEVTLTTSTSVNKINHLSNSILTIAADKILNVADTIKNYGTIINHGTISGAVLVPVIFEENGGSEVLDLMKLYGSSFNLPQPVKSGYVLENWYTDMELTQVYVPSPMPLNRLTLYAKWEFPTEVVTLEEETLKLYPNPTTTGFTIISGARETLLTICDLNGRKVLTQKVTGVDYVDARGLVPGVYIVRLNDKNFKLVKR